MNKIVKPFVDGFREAVKEFFKPLKTRWFWVLVVLGMVFLFWLDKH